MRRFLASLIVLSCGCAFEDGNPWGRAEFAVVARFAPAASRLDDGRLRTAKDYRVQIDELAVSIASVEAEVATSGDARTFDPADPPPGYSLCHNGHCHADDGSLVDYADIEAERAGGDFVVAQSVDRIVTLNQEPTQVPLGECSDDCHLDRGELSLVRLRLRELRIAGSVTDVRDRLPDTIDLDARVPLDIAVVAPVSAPINRTEPGVVVLDVDFELPPEFLDEVDFSTASVDENSLQLDSSVTVNVTRRKL